MHLGYIQHNKTGPWTHTRSHRLRVPLFSSFASFVSCVAFFIMLLGFACFGLTLQVWFGLVTHMLLLTFQTRTMNSHKESLAQGSLVDSFSNPSMVCVAVFALHISEKSVRVATGFNNFSAAPVSTFIIIIFSQV